MDYNTFAENIKTKYPQYQDMDNKELAQKMVAKYPEYKDVSFDSAPIQGSIEKNVLADAGNSLVSGLTEIPRAIEKVTNPVIEPIANAISYPVSQGINLLKGKSPQSFKDYNQQQNNLRNQLSADYQPQTGIGKVANFVGSLASTLLLPEANAFKGANLLSKIGNRALTGAYQGGLIGGVNAENSNQNTLHGIGQGASIGGLVGGGLPIAGQAFEKGIAPLGGYLSGVDQKSIQRALEANKNGRSVFAKNVNQDELNNLGEIVGQEARNLDAKGSISYSDTKNDIQNALREYSTSGEINPVADALKGKLNKIQKYLDKYKPQVETVENVIMPDGNKFSRKEFVDEFGMQPEEYTYAKTALEQNSSGGDIPPSVLHDIKQSIYDDVNFDKTKGLKRTDRENEAYKKIAKYQNKRLRDLSSEYAQANDNYAQMAGDLKAKQDFSEPLKYKSPYMLARLGAPIVGAGLTHNPLVLGLELATSPRLNQSMIQLYNQGSKFSRFAPQVINTANNSK